MEKIAKFSTKKLLLLVLVGFAIYFVASKWVGIETVISVINKANPFFILLAFLAEIIAYLGTGFLLWSIFQHLKVRFLKFSDLFKLGTVTVLAIHSLPISVFGEAAFSYYFLRQKKVPIGSILAMLITRLIFSYTAFFILLGASLLIMPILRDVSLPGKIASLIVFLALAIGIILGRNLYRNFQRFQRVVGRIINFLDRAKKQFLNRAQLSSDQKESVIKDIHQGFSPLDSSHIFIKQTGIAAIYWFGDMLCLFLVLCSLGFVVNPIKLIVVYGIATTLGAISLIPGGLGIVEGSLGLLLVNIGIPIDITVMAVIGYRLLSFWLMIPVGLLSLISLNRGKEKNKQIKN
jgi:uncharacterized protein (TIRG00374 family)